MVKFSLITTSIGTSLVLCTWGVCLVTGLSETYSLTYLSVVCVSEILGAGL